MSNDQKFPGFGVMLKMLAGNRETVEAHNAAVGKTIASAGVEHESGRYRSRGDNEGRTFILRFTDGTGLKFWDDGQSCCERRYMVCDDDLSYLSGATFTGAELRNAPTVNGEYGETECQFLVINTDKGSATIANYNEHNGYYGGFAVEVREIPHA